MENVPMAFTRKSLRAAAQVDRLRVKESKKKHRSAGGLRNLGSFVFPTHTQLNRGKINNFFLASQ